MQKQQHLQEQNHIQQQQQQTQQHQAQGQDSRRTLIKNQLYLIEQLQLENANLRNERDLLQLENEELKFQLQMISSSQILGQSARGGDDDDEDASAFGDRQLANITETTTAATTIVEVACESDETTTTTTTTQANDENASLATGDNNNSSQGYRRPVKGRRANHVTRPVISRQHNEKSTTNKAATIDNERSTSDQLQLLTKITATPVRQPLGLMNCDDLTFSSRDTRATGDAVTATAKTKTAAQVDSGRVASLANGLARPSDNQLLAQLSASAIDDDDDDEQDGDARTRLVQQLYGDCDKVQAAAVVIQRAFRKQQICKRFRMITDQLRSHTQRQHQPVVVIAEQQQQQKSMDAAVPYASGATRAAAWESLSQAASRLAESAAAARHQRNGAKQTSECCEQTQQVVEITTATKSMGNGQQTIETTSSSSTLASDSSGSSGRGTTTTSSTTGSVHEQQQQVVAATALNFQQLESIRKRQYRVGLNIFNKSPEKGISFLIAHSFIDCSPPYTRSSSQTTNTTSYYLSNQLHFIDKQHCLTTSVTRQARRSPTLGDNNNHQVSQTTAAAIMDAASRESCRFCFEEENLKMNVAHFLLHRKGLAKEKIGQYLGNLQCKFNQDVLVYYLQELDFYGLQVDVALRKFSTSVRMPGEAQKIERFVDRFAARYVECQQQQSSPVLRPNDSATNNFMTTVVSSSQPILLTSSGVTGRTTPDQAESNSNSNTLGGNTTDVNTKNNLTLLLLTKDEIFILTFAIIMLNTDLHSPSLKSNARMSSHQFINNLRGVFKSQTINESDLIEIYERVKTKQITTTPDHVTHVMKVQQGLTTQNFREKKELPNLCVAHRRLVCFCRLFEVYDVNKKERPGQHQREIFLFNDMLLVTKLARGRTRANTPQQYTYRQCIMLRGLYVQLFRSAHYCFGIRLCQRSDDATLIMFNARNELDQSRFVDDLNESIAEMDEMETIRAHNIVETIHFKQQDRLRRHQMMHDPSQGLIGANSMGRDEQKNRASPQRQRQNTGRQAPSSETAAAETTDDSFLTNGSNVTVIQVAKSRRMSASKFSSMSNLASLAESDECESNSADAQLSENMTRPKDGSSPDCTLRPNRSFADSKIPERHQSDGHKSSPQRLGTHLMSTVTNGLAGRILRSCSTNSVHSLDSGLFLSRDVSPNQSG